MVTGEENLTDDANYKTSGGEREQKPAHEGINIIGHKTGMKEYNQGMNINEELRSRLNAPKGHG